MSGYPHGLDAPDGDQAGGQMNVREALERLTEGTALGDMIWAKEYATFYAPRFERALQATAQEMAEMLTRVEAGDWLIDQCVTAGVAAMMEKK